MLEKFCPYYVCKSQNLSYSLTCRYMWISKYHSTCCLMSKSRQQQKQAEFQPFTLQKLHPRKSRSPKDSSLSFAIGDFLHFYTIQSLHAKQKPCCPRQRTKTLPTSIRVAILISGCRYVLGQRRRRRLVVVHSLHAFPATGEYLRMTLWDTHINTDIYRYPFSFLTNNVTYARS